MNQVVDERGGCCVELNPLLGWLLRKLGFSVAYLECCVNDYRDPAFIPQSNPDGSQGNFVSLLTPPTR